MNGKRTNGFLLAWASGARMGLRALPQAGTICAVVAVLLAAPTVCRGDELEDPEVPADIAAAMAEQGDCPVMANNPIKPDIYAVYQGKRVFFCCEMCKSAFQDNPEKYIARLPQFAASTSQSGAEPEAYTPTAGPSTAGFAKPTGILTLCLVALAVLLALLRRVKGLGARFMLQLHKIVGVCALASGAVHAVIVISSR